MKITLRTNLIEWKVLTNKGFEVFFIVLNRFLLSELNFTI